MGLRSSRSRAADLVVGARSHETAVADWATLLAALTVIVLATVTARGEVPSTNDAWLRPRRSALRRTRDPRGARARPTCRGGRAGTRGWAHGAPVSPRGFSHAHRGETAKLQPESVAPRGPVAPSRWRVGGGGCRVSLGGRCPCPAPSA
jgi:hypothetical protein